MNQYDTLVITPRSAVSLRLIPGMLQVHLNMEHAGKRRQTIDGSSFMLMRRLLATQTISRPSTLNSKTAGLIVSNKVEGTTV